MQRAALIAVWLLWMPALLDAAFTPPPSAYTRTVWTEKDGLPANHIFAIAQDRQGFLWLATRAGLTRFDGTRFVLWKEPRTASILPVRTVVAAQDGGLWIAFHNAPRVGRIHERQLTTYEGLPGPVLALMQTRDGTIWAGGRGGLSLFRRNQWQPLEKALGVPAPTVNALFEDRDGNILVGTSRGVYRRNVNGESFDFVLPTSSPGEHDFVHLPTGNVLINDARHIVADVTGKDGVNDKIIAVEPGEGLHLLHDKRGHLWLATRSKGLLRFSNYPHGIIERISSDSIRSLFEDAEGNIWMGTADGLVRLSTTRITSFAAPTREGVPFARGLTQATDGSMWVGTLDGVVRFVGSTQTDFSTRPDFSKTAVTSLHTNGNGIVWIGTDQGIAAYENDRITLFQPPGRLPPNPIYSITSDADEGLWVSDLEALFRLKDGNWKPFEEVHGPAQASYTDTRGRLWFGMWEGQVVLYENDRFRWYSQANGLSGAPVAGIAEDSGGAIWVATSTGVSRFADDRFTTLFKSGGLPGDRIIALVIDDDDYVWLGLDVGIVRIDPDEFEKAVGDDSYRVQYRLYDSSDGLIGMPTRGAYPNAIRANDGRLWFTTTDGLAVVDPRHLQENRSPPPVIIESVLVDGRELGLPNPVRFPPGIATLQIDYTAPAIAAASKMRFRHMLEGFDTNWVDGDSSRRVSYTNLPPVATTCESARALATGPGLDRALCGTSRSHLGSIRPDGSSARAL